MAGESIKDQQFGPCGNCEVFASTHTIIEERAKYFREVAMLKFFRIRKGFTLVELLIVVAIIGVLSTLGIPTFRKMVQKAKKSEAKVALGGLYTAETAFFSEYGVYGSYLDKIGFELSGGGGGGTYTIGFPTGTCATEATAMPDATKTNLDDVYPSYFPVPGGSSVKPAQARAPTNCKASTTKDDGTDFVATATGAINPNADPATATVVDGQLDSWTVDKNRNLKNDTDGVK